MSNCSLNGRIVRLAVVAVLFCVFSNSWPQQESAAERAMRKAQGLLRQLASEKKALELKNSEMVFELEKASAEIAKQQAALAEQHKVNQAFAENNAILVERVQSDHEKMQDMIGKYQAKQAELALYQHDHALLKKAVVERDQWMAQCRQNNTSLLDAGKELLRRYDEKSLWDAFVGQEPLLGIARVDQEVQEQEYRFKLEDLKVRSATLEPDPLKIEKVPQSNASDNSSDQQ